MADTAGESPIAPIPRPGLAALLWTLGIFLLIPAGHGFYELGVRAVGRHGFPIALRAAGILFTLLLIRHVAPRLQSVSWPRRLAALACLLLYATVVSRLALPEELSHPLAYLPLGLLLDQALARRLPPWTGVLAASAMAAAVGALDECIQALMPARFFDATDVALDLLAAAVPLVFLRLTDPRGEAESSVPPRSG